MFNNRIEGSSLASSFTLWVQMTKVPTAENVLRGQKHLYLYLSKFPQSRMTSALNLWHESIKLAEIEIRKRKMLGMIFTLQRIFASKAKRIYHPTRIIKDADAIMRRTIKKLITIKNHLFDSAMTRWKFYIFGKYHQEKAVLIFRASQNTDMFFRDAFMLWKEKKKLN